ncbi:MAG: replicative DNA helicase [Zymomonas mobilis subsp. pomaceae]|uniref:replicative DNA helicase n=1 Tax=Zymomonas mobilis TaxID=542 RepID=UPI0039E8A06D
MAEVLTLASNLQEKDIGVPANIQAEAALLGALLIDNRLAEDVQVKLRAEHFFDPTHGLIYQTIMRQIDRNQHVTPVILQPLLEKDPGLQTKGGIKYVVELAQHHAALLGVRDFAAQIYDLALLRELISVGREMVDNAMDTQGIIDPLSQIEEAEASLYRVAESGVTEGGVKSFAQAANIAVKAAEMALHSGANLSGITTGLDTVNAKIGGLHRSDLLILAGRPGMGKTAFATNVAFNAAQRYMYDIRNGLKPEESAGAPVAFFSLEMSADQLATRLLAEQSQLSSEDLRMGKIRKEEFRNLARAATELEELPLYIDDTPGLTIASLRTRARRLKRRHNIGLLVVDYLQLLHGSGKANDNRVNEISEISRGLKTLAKELDIPVLALSQLSRAVEQREDKRPQLSDLRESGSIEQDADIVLFVYREEYYLQSREPKRAAEKSDSPIDARVDEEHRIWQQSMEQVYNMAELIVAKQRHGATGKVRLRFESRITRFSDPVDDNYMPSEERV